MSMKTKSSRRTGNKRKIRDWMHWKPSRKFWYKGWRTSSECQVGCTIEWATEKETVFAQRPAAKEEHGKTFETHPDLNPWLRVHKLGAMTPTTLTTPDPHNNTNKTKVGILADQSTNDSNMAENQFLPRRPRKPQSQQQHQRMTACCHLEGHDSLSGQFEGKARWKERKQQGSQVAGKIASSAPAINTTWSTSQSTPSKAFSPGLFNPMSRSLPLSQGIPAVLHRIKRDKYHITVPSRPQPATSMTGVILAPSSEAHIQDKHRFPPRLRLP
ncbi:hypothetical protein BKA70DRAFT_1241896 [Coprinopsis sp. MPI-PUGE-AT-0042]|nr:hypothetical protein BKA70DRAFT_1241896 [Coprinopsis sp. MPI-PUGE-AT-0042]